MAGVNVRLDQTSTNKGVIYAFHRQPEDEQQEDLAAHFEEFSHIANLCATDPAAAEELINGKNANLAEVTLIVARYAKEMRRLQVDFKHAREQKLLSIRHRLESELVDSNLLDNESALEGLVDSIVPKVVNSFTPRQLLPTLEPTAKPNLTINFNPQFIDQVTGIVAQEVNGNVDLSVEDKQLLQLFQRFGDAKQAELISALHELNDKSAPEGGRVTAKQKLKRFLIACAQKSGDLAVGVLQSYIEKKLLGM